MNSNKKTRILLIDAFGMNGGAEKVMINTYKVLKNKFTVFCMMPEASEYKNKLPKGDFIGFKNTFNLIRTTIKISPDIVILNNKKALKYLIPLKIFIPKLKVIYHSHSYFRNKFELIIYQNIFLKLLSKVICVSHSLELNHTNGVNFDTKHAVIYNGFDFNFNNISSKNLKNEHINIFFWAQFREWKGHLFLLDIIKNTNHIKVRYHFVANIQDEESKKLYSKIKKKIEHYNLGSIVKLHINIDDHLQFINKNADISLSCSQIQDPLPTIIIESLAMGIPILATNVGGSAEILEPFPDLLANVELTSFENKLSRLIANYKDYKSNTLKDYFKLTFNEDTYTLKIINFIPKIN